MTLLRLRAVARRTRRVVAGLATALACGACSRPAPPAVPNSAAHGVTATAALAQPVDGPAASRFEALVTLQDLMREEVDPSADAIWSAVGSVTTRAGVVEKRPRADAEWATLRRHAVVLLEATNLLVIPGRKVSTAPFPSDGPGVFGSLEIQERIDAHRDEFDGYAVALRAVANQELAAIDARDATALWSLGEGMDDACEACHRANWYPHQVIPPLPATPPSPR